MRRWRSICGDSLQLMSAYLPSPRGEGDPLAGDEVHSLDRGRMLTFASAGGAKPSAARRYAAVGWVGGGYPSAPLKARTAASDGQTASTRAARSAGLRFAVRSWYEAIDVGREYRA